MQEVCRLKKATIEILSPLSDDPNEAIVLLAGRVRVLNTELEKERAVTAALRAVPHRGSQAFTPSGAQPVSVIGIPDDYWKEFDKRISNTIEKYSRGY